MSTVQRTVVDTNVVAFVMGLAIGSLFEFGSITFPEYPITSVILFVLFFPRPMDVSPNRPRFFLLSVAGALTAIIIMRSLPKQYLPFEGLGFLLVILLSIYWESKAREDSASEPLL